MIKEKNINKIKACRFYANDENICRFYNIIQMTKSKCKKRKMDDF